jgi:hypothetical protein
MDRQEIRQHIWLYLGSFIQAGRNRTQQNDIWNHFTERVEGWNNRGDDAEILHEELHHLVTANILLPGVAGSDRYYPHFTISKFGEECLRSGNTLPFDPDGYVRELQNRIPNIDPIALDYLREAIACYARQLHLSSTICLGVSSEKCINLLIDSFARAISDATEKAKFESRINGRGIYIRFKVFSDELEKRRKLLPSDIMQNFEPMVDGIFNFIRLNRNSAGHPTGAVVDRVTLQANLQIFSSYADRVFTLINFLDNNKI